MSTCNFAHKNTKLVYAKDFETDENWEYEDFIDYATERLKTLDIPHVNEPKKIYNNDRSYPTTALVTFYKEGKTATAYITCVVRSGYYAGINLDFEDCEVENNENPYEEITEEQEQWGQEAYEELKALIEPIYKELTTPLVHVGTFSHGEAVYEKL